MPDFKTGTDKQTGERVIEVDGKVMPLANFKTGTDSKTGQRVVEVNGQIGTISEPPRANEIQTREPGTFGERATAGMSITPKGRLSYVQSIVGENNAILMPNGEVSFRRAENEMFRPFDATGPDIGDLADLSGLATETVPGLIVGAGRRTPAGFAGTALGTAMKAGVADTGGNVVRQFASAALPGDDEATARDRAMSATIAMGMGGAGQLAADKILTPAMERINPKNAIVSRSVQRQMDEPFAVKGARLSEQTGIPLSVGEQTGSRLMRMLEAVARRHPLSADRVANMDAQKVSAAYSRLERIADALSIRTGDEAAGNGVINAYRSAQRSAIDFRKATAGRDFAVIDSVAGEQAIMPVDAFIHKLDELIAGSQTMAIDSPARKALLKMRKDLVEAGANGGQFVSDGNALRVSGRVFQNTLEQFGQAARGTGDIMKDVSPTQQKRFAGELFGALQDDLNRIADADSVGGELATALRTARDNFRTNSAAIDSVNMSALGEIIGTRDKLPAPEVIVQKIDRLPPSQHREAIEFLKQSDPETLALLKRNTLDSLLEGATVSGSQKSADGITFSPSKFNTEILKPKVARKLRNLYTRQEWVEIKRVSKAMERINDRLGQGSPTSPLQWTMSAIGQLTGSAMSVPGAAQFASQLLSVRFVSEAMTNPEARKALIEVSQAKTLTKTAAQAGATLAGLIVAENQHKKEMMARDAATPASAPLMLGGL